MKTQKLLIAMMGLGAAMHAQQPPTTTSPASATLNGRNAGDFWSRAGNNNFQGANNIFGTAANFNSGIFTQTNGVNRMRLNGNSSYAVNGFPAMTRDGFLLLGGNASYSGGTLYGAANGGAFSLLHLNGVNPNNSAQESGYRDWMRYGITSTHNQDLMFIGQRATAVPDVTDATIAWADNAGTGPGPDNMIFTFLNGGDNGGGSDLAGSNNFGREIMRLTAMGNVGIGPRFNNANQPKSTLHQHQEDDASSWMQITNQYMTQAGPIQSGPTAIGAINGFRFGILGDPIKLQNGNAFIYNQENRHLILSTNHATPGVITTTNERVRITNFSAPTALPGGGYGTFIPSGSGNTAATDLTRVGISHNPSAPVTRPLSLLHLGYNASQAGANLDGWRPWMEIGTFTNSDAGASMYSGLKLFGTGGSDAVVGWGYTPYTNSTSSQSRMRFIFTTPTNAGNIVAAGANGIEAAHFWSDGNNTFMGVGDMQTANVDPQNTLEIRTSALSPYFSSGNGSSGLRFTNLTSGNTPVTPNSTNGVDNTKVLTVDKKGDVVLVTPVGGGPGGAVTAQNGLSNLSSNVIELGGPLGSAAAAKLLNSREIPLANNTLLFSQTGNVRIAQNPQIFAAGINPNFNVDITLNSINNVGALFTDGGSNSTAIRRNVDIQSNLNTTNANAIALNVGNSSIAINQGRYNSSRLIRVTSLDDNANGIQDDEAFAINEGGFSGFALDPAYYNAATVGVGDYNTGQGGSSPFTNWSGRTSLLVYNNKDNGQNARGQEIYAEGSEIVQGLYVTAKTNRFQTHLAYTERQ